MVGVGSLVLKLQEVRLATGAERNAIMQILQSNQHETQRDY